MSTNEGADPPSEVPPHMRPIAFAAAELLLDLLHELRQVYSDVDAESLLILLCVMEATMRSFMHEGPPPAEILVSPRPPDTVRGSISRRTIADKIGLPRETVRRKIVELARGGHVTVDADDRVRIAYGLADTRTWSKVERSHRAVLRYLERLEQYRVEPHKILASFRG